MFRSPLGHVEPMQLASQESPVQRRSLWKRWECSRGRMCRAGWSKWLPLPQSSSERLQQLGLRPLCSAPAQTFTLCAWSSISIHFHGSVRGYPQLTLQTRTQPQRAECLPHHDHTAGNTTSRGQQPMLFPRCAVVHTHVHTHHPAAQIFSRFSVYSRCQVKVTKDISKQIL